MATPLLTGSDNPDSSDSPTPRGGDEAVRSSTAGPVVVRLRALLDEAVATGTLGTGAKIPTERALSAP